MTLLIVKPLFLIDDSKVSSEGVRPLEYLKLNNERPDDEFIQEPRGDADQRLDHLNHDLLHQFSRRLLKDGQVSANHDSHSDKNHQKTVSVSDVRALINLSNFQFVINNNVCGDANYDQIMTLNSDNNQVNEIVINKTPIKPKYAQNLSILIIIHSAPDHFR